VPLEDGFTKPSGVTEMPGASVTGVLDVATVAALRSVQLCRQL